MVYLDQLDNSEDPDDWKKQVSDSTINFTQNKKKQEL